eukprot:g76902.t1
MVLYWKSCSCSAKGTAILVTTTATSTMQKEGQTEQEAEAGSSQQQQLQDLFAKRQEAASELSTAQALLQIKQRNLKKNEITLKEVEPLDEEIKAYKAVGRMFIRSSLPRNVLHKEERGGGSQPFGNGQEFFNWEIIHLCSPLERFSEGALVPSDSRTETLPMQS